MNDDAIIAAWLEFHDLDILHASWEGTTLRLAFRFGTVYDQSVSHYGYRTGAVTFYNATVIGSFPTDDDETWLWAGAIQADSKEFAMIPIEKMADTDGGRDTLDLRERGCYHNPVPIGCRITSRSLPSRTLCQSGFGMATNEPLMFRRRRP
ncbi:MAG: hypothetical protein H8F28_06285 [Fibrella sp.]|nr:hypothetical protein [Armatimonadota bacterium]